ncbi:MAG: tetratricopeptide repeat protein [Terriglobales bacterium]
MTEQAATRRLESNPRDAQALDERGIARLRLGKPEGAIADLERAVELDPASPNLWANLAFVLLKAGRVPEAMTNARVALRLKPDHSGAHFYLGRGLVETGGSLPEAIEHLRIAAEANPEDPEVNLELFNAYRSQGDTPSAFTQLRALRGIFPPNDARVFYCDALLQADLGNLDAAIRRFQRALELDPQLDPVRLDLGLALAKSSRWQEAKETVGPLARSQPGSFAAAYLHALALQNSQRAADAEVEARRAQALRPDSADAHALIGIILAGRGAHAEALEVLTRAAQLDPKNFDAQFYLGRARYALRDLPGSRDAFRAALEIRPDDVEARFFLATVLEAAGEKDPAIAEYRDLIARRPQDARGYIGLGAVLAKYGEVESALEQLRRAREMAPQDFEAALALGRLLVKEGRVEEGIKSLEESVALAPSSPEAHYQLGLAFRRAGRTTEAQREFATVDQLNRQRRSASNGMGQTSDPEKKP